MHGCRRRRTLGVHGVCVSPRRLASRSLGVRWSSARSIAAHYASRAMPMTSGGRRTALVPRCGPFAELSRWSLATATDVRSARLRANTVGAGCSRLGASAMRRRPGAQWSACFAALTLGLAAGVEGAYNTTLTRGAGLTLNGCSGAPAVTNAAQLAQLAKDIVSGNPSGWATASDMRLGPCVDGERTVLTAQQAAEGRRRDHAHARVQLYLLVRRLHLYLPPGLVRRRMTSATDSPQVGAQSRV